MRHLRVTSQFKKDLKRYKNRRSLLEELNEVLRLLQSDIALPQACKPHRLTGDYKDCLECHIANDFLLIWIDCTTQEIVLLRLGSHSELFGKGVKR